MISKEFARRLRLHVLEMTNKGGSSHIGSIFSIAEIVAVLYNEILKFDPENPKAEHRDRFILSKGHAGAIIYAALAEKGFFEIERLKTHYQDGSGLSGHVSHLGVPGIDVSTGSLGHGLSIAAGMAKALKIKKASQRVFCILSDGECNEGSTWEAALFAGHHKLNNLIAIVDYNKMQAMGFTRDIMDLEPFIDKWKAFGFSTEEVDGNNTDSLLQVFNKLPLTNNKPSLILAHTLKGRGVSFMENNLLWHYRCPKGEEFIKARTEIESN